MVNLVFHIEKRPKLSTKRHQMTNVLKVLSSHRLLPQLKSLRVRVKRQTQLRTDGLDCTTEDNSEKDGDQGIPGREIWTSGLRESGVGGTRQNRTETSSA